jgi:hypothetical protein
MRGPEEYGAASGSRRTHREPLEGWGHDGERPARSKAAWVGTSLAAAATPSRPFNPPLPRPWSAASGQARPLTCRGGGEQLLADSGATAAAAPAPMGADAAETGHHLRRRPMTAAPAPSRPRPAWGTEHDTAGTRRPSTARPAASVEAASLPPAISGSQQARPRLRSQQWQSEGVSSRPSAVQEARLKQELRELVFGRGPDGGKHGWGVAGSSEGDGFVPLSVRLGCLSGRQRVDAEQPLVPQQQPCAALAEHGRQHAVTGAVIAKSPWNEGYPMSEEEVCYTYEQARAAAAAAESTTLALPLGTGAKKAHSGATRPQRTAQRAATQACRGLASPPPPHVPGGRDEVLQPPRASAAAASSPIATEAVSTPAAPCVEDLGAAERRRLDEDLSRREQRLGCQAAARIGELSMEAKALRCQVSAAGCVSPIRLQKPRGCFDYPC